MNLVFRRSASPAAGAQVPSTRSFSKLELKKSSPGPSGVQTEPQPFSLPFKSSLFCLPRRWLPWQRSRVPPAAPPVHIASRFYTRGGRQRAAGGFASNTGLPAGVPFHATLSRVSPP